jgi:hypothetical protein
MKKKEEKLLILQVLEDIKNYQVLKKRKKDGIQSIKKMRFLLAQKNLKRKLVKR